MSISHNCKWLRWNSSCNGAKRYIMWLLLMLSFAMAATDEPWERPGCFLTGCVEFFVPLNACSGYCNSSAFATSPDDLEDNPRQVLTSRSSCCNIVRTEDVPVTVACRNGMTDFTLKSAISCECSQCKKDSN